MNTTLKKKDDGFTIIEVVLVLAIAGLIFLIVFLALPQLQASRRDTQRKNDASRLVAGVENYAGNNSGQYPGSIDQAWVDANISGGLISPDGAGYTYDGSVDDVNDMHYTLGSLCPGAPGSASGRNFNVQVKLENGTYCQDNQ
ncbi:MAG: type II secretion system protein [Candidatus Saccharimonadales bacterium]|nr:type II secretion system protein [Candidatus Saccharimonadales bacterium]